MRNKILKIVLIAALALVAFLLSTNPCVIVIAFFAILAVLKKDESAESEAERRMMDEFKNMMDSFTVKNDSNPQTDGGEYETLQSGLFTVKYRKRPQESKPTPQPGPRYTEEQAKRLLRYIRDSTGKDTVRIKPAPADISIPFEKRVCSSRFGGLPYWTRGEEYPAAEDGEPLYLLSQINFAEAPRIDDFPTRGLLQIFVKADGTYGCSFGTAQKDWRIVWREVFSPGLAMSEAELRGMGVKRAGEENAQTPLPLQKEYALSFEKTTTCCHPRLDDFDGVLKNAAQVLGFFVYDKSPRELFDSDSLSAFYCDGERHQIGGYPDFTQGDARREGDVLLFQMDSAGEIAWGDRGIANFFISPADLKARDFSNVLYNWGCH